MVCDGLAFVAFSGGSENLGHVTAAFILDIYGHVTDQMKQVSAARLERYIKDVLNL